MVFGVLSHLLHPHPAIEPLKLSAPIRAGFAASPVASFNTESDGYIANELQDPAPASAIRVWLKNYLGSSATDRWNEPSKTDAVWWSGLDTVVKEILITIASNEMMAADTQAFAATLNVSCVRCLYVACADELLQAVNDRVTLFASKNDFHAEPVIGLDLGLEEGEASRLIKSRVVERL